MSQGNGVRKCLEQFSVKAGGITKNKMLCESLFVKDVTCYDTRMKSGEEFQHCEHNSDCVTELIDGEGNVVGEGNTYCEVLSPNGWLCNPSSTSKQRKNYVKAFKEVRDNISKNKVHQSLVMKDDIERNIFYSSVLREKLLDLYTYNIDDCITDNLYVLIGSGFIKVSFTMIALLLFTIIA